MAKTDEISSTEKLLRLIRSKGKEGPVASPKVSSPTPSSEGKVKKHRPADPAGRRPRRKGMAVGVDIGESDIKLVGVGLGPDKAPVLLNWAVLPMEPGMAEDAARMSRFLKSALSGFCHHTGKTKLWGCISSANVQTRALKIPKVANKQIPNAVLWALRKEAAFNEKTDIFDYHIIGEILEDNAVKYQAMASIAPKQTVDNLKRLFSRCGYPLTGISIVPFALQNLLQSGWLETAEEEVCALFIGKDWSRIAIFSKGSLVLSRDIKAGMKSLVQSLSEGIESLQDEISFQLLDMRDRIWEDPAERQVQLDASQAQQILDEFVASDGAQDPSPSAVLPAEDLFEMIRPALDRILRQVEMTFEHYHQHFSSRRVQRVYVSGQVSGQAHVRDYFKDQLGLDVTAMDPFGHPFLAEGVAGPESAQVRADFVPAVGLALSQNRLTPNFLYTYRDKLRKRTVRRIDSLVLVAFALMMVALGGVSKYLSHENHLKDQRLARLQKQLDQFSPRLDKTLVMELAGQTVFQMKRLATISHRYLGLAVVNEIARITPEKIKLVSLKVELGPKGGRSKKGATRHVIVDGVVLGDRLAFDAVLAEYMIDLDNSKLLEKPSIEKRSLETINEDDVLRFAVRLTIH